MNGLRHVSEMSHTLILVSSIAKSRFGQVVGQYLVEVSVTSRVIQNPSAPLKVVARGIRGALLNSPLLKEWATLSEGSTSNVDNMY